MESIFKNNQERWVINDAVRIIVYGDHIGISIAPVEKGTAFQKLKLVKEGLRLLQEKIKNTNSLRNKKTILGASWIMSEYPNVVERLGFHITKNHEVYNAAIADYIRHSSSLFYKGISPEKKSVSPGFACVSVSEFIKNKY